MPSIPWDSIETREVLAWRRLHLLHAPMSACSAKVRIAFNIEKLAWCSHDIDLSCGENLTPWFLGINPNGLVPVLVHDGHVHVESNDILLQLESHCPSPCLIPEVSRAAVEELLTWETGYHLDRRTLSFRFIFDGSPRRTSPMGACGARGRSIGLETRRQELAATLGNPDCGASIVVADETVRAAVERFRCAFDRLDLRLSGSRYLAGMELSLADVAWFVQVNRLSLAGYPFRRLNPAVLEWYGDLMGRDEFSAEVSLSPTSRGLAKRNRERQQVEGRTLEAICGI